jgi:Ni/Fe-hydrogenase subunit HybB-like protein
VSSIYAGLAMIIVEGTISRKVFRHLFTPDPRYSFDEIIFGLSKGAAIVMCTYYFLKALLFIHDKQWVLLGDGWGLWYLLEVIGLVLVPAVMFAFGHKHRNLAIIKIAAVMALLGVVLNRLNVSVIAFNWYVHPHYFPSWQEFSVAFTVIFAEIWVLRWFVTRMPVFSPRH